MNKVFIAKGYNSWTNKEILKAFISEQEADAFIQGLTDPHIQVIGYKNTAQLVNTLLGANND
jgi:hypothetical protein